MNASTPFTAIDLPDYSARHRVQIEESALDPRSLFHLGDRVVDALGHPGTVTDERIVHTGPCHEHRDAPSAFCFWCAEGYQRITVTRDGGGWSEQAAHHCAFAPLPPAEAAAELERIARDQALREADHFRRYGC